MIIQTSVNIKDRGEVTLSLLPLEEYETEPQEPSFHKYALVETIADKDEPYFLFTASKGAILQELGPKRSNIIESEESLKSILDDLKEQIFSATQSGTLVEFDSIDQSNDIKPYNPESIRIEPKNFSLRQISELVTDGDLNLMPDFQRNKVWDKTRKSRLIESILLRIPLPVFYFSEDEEGRYTVVDGLQRLSTICDFMDNRFKLEDLEYLHDCCQGKTYNKEGNKIEDKFYRRFNSYQIAVNIISSDSPVRVKYDIFRRLNTGGMPLNLQEIRNCFACQPLRNLLKAMVDLESFKKATGNLADTRMQAQEFALRYIFFLDLLKTRNGIESYSGKIDEELDSCIDSINSNKKFDADSYLQSFDTAMKNAYYLFGRHSFRKVKTNTTNQTNRLIINKLLFESWSIVLSQYDTTTIKNKFEENSFIGILGSVLDSDNQYRDYVSYGTNGKANVLYAFNKSFEIMKEKISET